MTSATEAAIYSDVSERMPAILIPNQAPPLKTHCSSLPLLTSPDPSATYFSSRSPFRGYPATKCPECRRLGRGQDYLGVNGQREGAFINDVHKNV